MDSGEALKGSVAAMYCIWRYKCYVFRQETSYDCYRRTQGIPDLDAPAGSGRSDDRSCRRSPRPVTHGFRA
ncbi:hypothetical protein MPLB_250063 [Mesorhizobium sp. ORS 3324]|nr:hypothetical protein MPLB_250063 [Mesorhizobium sp. ORS 3324]